MSTAQSSDEICFFKWDKHDKSSSCDVYFLSNAEVMCFHPHLREGQGIYLKIRNSKMLDFLLIFRRLVSAYMDFCRPQLCAKS